MAKAGLTPALAGGLVMAGALAVTPAAVAQAEAVSPLLPGLRYFPGSLLLPPPESRVAPRDTCGASAFGWLVGLPRSRIPIAVDLNGRRVSCIACVVAPEVRPGRLDILYDARTDHVARISCG